MRLVPVDTTHNDGVVICCHCTKRVLLSKCNADLDGGAFKSYYCEECTAEVRKGNPE